MPQPSIWMINKVMETESWFMDNNKIGRYIDEEDAKTYEKLGGSDNLKRAIEIYEKNLAARERLVKSTLRSYRQYKSKENEENGKHLVKPEFLQKLKGIPYTGMDETVIQSERELAGGYMKIAEILEKLGGDDNLAKARERYRQALEIRELLEVTLQVIEDMPKTPTPSVIKFGGLV